MAKGTWKIGNGRNVGQIGGQNGGRNGCTNFTTYLYGGASAPVYVDGKIGAFISTSILTSNLTSISTISNFPGISGPRYCFRRISIEISEFPFFRGFYEVRNSQLAKIRGFYEVRT